jgi:hypothetical protein
LRLGRPLAGSGDDSTARTRTGWRRIIPAWEYRHLRVFANLPIGASFFLAIFGTITLAYSAYGWTAFFWVLAAAHFLYGPLAALDRAVRIPQS